MPVLADSFPGRSRERSQHQPSVRMSHPLCLKTDLKGLTGSIEGDPSFFAGTLITAPLNQRYLLTADHCFVDKKAINNFEYW